MKSLVAIMTVAALAVAFGAVAVSAEEIPAITDQNRELGVVVGAWVIDQSAGMKVDMGKVFARYADFPSITDLKNGELSAVLTKSLEDHATGMKGAAAGGLGAEKAATPAFLGPGGSDLP